jgi:DNA-binding transcriptional LysR family regulator
VQSHWNDLRYLLAIKRGQTLRAAARQLHVNVTTVSRRLASLQQDVGERLIQPRGGSKLVLTEVGERVALAAEAMERHFASIAALVRGDTYSGSVRLTSVPILANRLFARSFGDLATRYPNLVVELIPDSRDFNLTRRDADIAVRLARPATGGMRVKAHRVGTLNYAAYVSRVVPQPLVRRLPWISYEDSMSHLPQARWMQRAGRRDATGQCSLRVHDAETALEAAVAGLGKTLLPSLVAERDPRLRRVDVTAAGPLPAREVWLLVHADQLELARVAAVIDWIKKLVAMANPGPRRVKAP